VAVEFEQNPEEYMTEHIIRRVLQSLLVLFSASILVFAIVRLTGDPVSLMVPMDASPETVEAIREKLGLDEPIVVQYIHFLGNALKGDLGTSIRHQQPALQLVLDRMPATLELAFTGMFIALVIAAPLGIISAIKSGTLIDLFGISFALLGQAIPVFWLGLEMISLFSVRWRLLPAIGRGGVEHVIMPAITVGTYTAATIVRVMRTSMLEVLREDYLRTARGKGLREWGVILRHALPNALIPVVTVLGLQLSALLGGAIVTETVFAWPGVGLLAIQAIFNRDYPVVQAVVLVVATIFVTVNLLVDIAYVALDPRIRYD
jgi:peptide/nickel transport system permease protein